MDLDIYYVQLNLVQGQYKNVYNENRTDVKWSGDLTAADDKQKSMWVQ